jgi:hypothetical protein
VEAFGVPLPPLCLALLVWSVGLPAPGAVARVAVERAVQARALPPTGREEARARLERTASAAGDREAIAEALFGLGELDEEDGAFDRAVAHDRACAAAAPDTRWAVRANDRIEWIRARSEGGFAPLARLERVRRDPALADDPAALDALAREAESFPPGLVRVEARMLVAEAWLGRMGRPRDAMVELRRVADDPRAGPVTAALAERELVGALAAGGAIAEAAAEARAHASLLDPRFVRDITRLLRRQWIRWGAIVVLAGFAWLAALALEGARRRRALGEVLAALRGVAPVALSFVAFVGLAGGLLASRYESGNAAPFLLLAAGTLPLVFVARAWSAAGSNRAPARLARALFCGATVLAAAFILLDAAGPDYLEGFGL